MLQFLHESHRKACLRYCLSITYSLCAVFLPLSFSKAKASQYIPVRRDRATVKAMNGVLRSVFLALCESVHRGALGSCSRGRCSGPPRPGIL